MPLLQLLTGNTSGLTVDHLGGKDRELLDPERIWIEGTLGLSPAHHGVISMPDRMIKADVGDLNPT